MARSDVDRALPRGGPVLFLIATIAVGAYGASSASCYRKSETTCSQEDEPLTALRGEVRALILVRDENGNAVKNPDGTDMIVSPPQAGSLVFVELCGHYTKNPDPAKGHPNYRYAALTDENGHWEVQIPQGAAGLHTFKHGYTYGTVDTAVAQRTPDGRVIVFERENAGAFPAQDDAGTDAGPAPEPNTPVLSGFTVAAADGRTGDASRPLDVVPGELLSFAVNARARGRDPMSEEVLVMVAQTKDARAFAPPRRGNPGHSYPDGIWTASMPAPSAPGAYTIYAQSTSEGCIVSNRLELEVVVK